MSCSLIEKKADPCRVCGEANSAGWHCGTITCEACKKFFLRNINGEYLQFKCVRQTGECVITRKTRTNCAYCRFQKCLQVGMKSNEKSHTESVSFKSIPCTVCMDSSSGLHFGAITCEGCKGFFRRNVNESKKFVCLSNNNCEISYKTRNGCRACRFSKCLQVGMDLNNCKIGRQSNLFKQKLKNVMISEPTGAGDSSSSSTPSSSSSASSSATNIEQIEMMCNLNDNSSNIEDQIEDQNTRVLIKSFFQFYKHVETSKIIFSNKMLHDHEIALEFLTIHAQNCANFVTGIPLFQRYNSQDQHNLLLSSIHSIRLLQIINQSNYFNYFNCDNQLYEKIIKYFPIFDKTIDYLKDISDRIRELKLDTKETAIYMAYLAYSSSFKTTDMRNQMRINLECSRALSQYMFRRRNDTEASELLIELSFRLEKVNLTLQQGIYENLQKLRSMGFCISQAYENVCFTQLVSRMYHQQN